jgi:hypothetical protein
MDVQEIEDENNEEIEEENKEDNNEQINEDNNDENMELYDNPVIKDEPMSVKNKLLSDKSDNGKIFAIEQQAYQDEDQHMDPIDQPIQLPIDQPIDQPINLPIDKQSEQSIEQHIDQHIDQPLEHPLEQSIEQPLEKYLEQPLEQPLEHHIDQPIEQSLDVKEAEPVVNNLKIENLLEDEDKIQLKEDSISPHYLNLQMEDHNDMEFELLENNPSPLNIRGGPFMSFDKPIEADDQHNNFENNSYILKDHNQLDFDDPFNDGRFSGS